MFPISIYFCSILILLIRLLFSTCWGAGLFKCWERLFWATFFGISFQQLMNHVSRAKAFDSFTLISLRLSKCFFMLIWPTFFLSHSKIPFCSHFMFLQIHRKLSQLLDSLQCFLFFLHLQETIWAFVKGSQRLCGVKFNYISLFTW